MQHPAKLGISGTLAAIFKQNQITPLLALVGLVRQLRCTLRPQV